VSSKAPSSSVLRVESLEKRFGGVTALDGITLEVRRGETLGLIGPNGSGKTTFVNCVSGVLRPSGGAIYLSGAEIGGWSREQRARAGLIRTYQNLRLFPSLTVTENIEAGLLKRRLDGRTRRREVAAALERQGLARVARTVVSGLAYGQQRRVEIARAIVARPEILILDEPAAGLGEEETLTLQRGLESVQDALGCSMIVIDHDVSLIMRISSRVIALHQGSILAQGSPREVASDPDVIAVYLGTEEHGVPS
jgi:ABC-type branched-subunit amino acid transport system ATPase component